MGYDPQENKFVPISQERYLNAGNEGIITLYKGEEVELKGILFTVVDIAPGQIKLKPKRLKNVPQQKN